MSWALDSLNIGASQNQNSRESEILTWEYQIDVVNASYDDHFLLNDKSVDKLFPTLSSLSLVTILVPKSFF